MIFLIILGALLCLFGLGAWMVHSLKKAFEQVEDSMDEPYESTLYNRDFSTTNYEG